MADRDPNANQYWMEPDGTPRETPRVGTSDPFASEPTRAFDGARADDDDDDDRPTDDRVGAPSAGRALHIDVEREPRTPAPDPATLRAEIRDTRERLGDTLEQIGERLNPHYLSRQVQHTLRDATIGKVEHMARHAADRVSETRSSVIDTIRDNPVPAAMVGLGLGWLFMNRRRPASPFDARYATDPRDVRRVDAYDTGAYGARTTPGSSYGYGSAYGGAYGGSADAHDPAGPLDRVRERAGELGDDVREAAGELAERTQHAAAGVAQQSRRQAQRLEDRFHEQPLVVGAATLALGLAAGLSLPVSDREVQLMGDARDRLVDRVRDVAEETKDKVQHVASRVVDEAQHTARDAARDEGLLNRRPSPPPV